MLDYQKRVVEEKAELDEKLSKLTDFVRSDFFSEEVNALEQARLVNQRKAMQSYSDILGERIAAFTE